MEWVREFIKEKILNLYSRKVRIYIYKKYKKMKNYIQSIIDVYNILVCFTVCKVHPLSCKLLITVFVDLTFFILRYV